MFSYVLSSFLYVPKFLLRSPGGEELDRLVELLISDISCEGRKKKNKDESSIGAI